MQARRVSCRRRDEVPFEPTTSSVATMATPSISLPPEQPIALPELPPDLLLTLLTKKHVAPSPSSGPPERDALDSFVLSGAGGFGEGAGGIQVEDVLNELLPNGVWTVASRASLQVGRAPVRSSRLANADATPLTCRGELESGGTGRAPPADQDPGTPTRGGTLDRLARPRPRSDHHGPPARADRRKSFSLLGFGSMLLPPLTRTCPL